MLQEGTPELKELVQGVQANSGNAITVMQSSELVKFLKGEAVDNREYGSSAKQETLDSYARIQKVSDTQHLAINKAVITQALKALRAEGGEMQVENFSFEKQLRPGLQSDVVYPSTAGPIAIEFHHKAATETVNSKVAVYILTKLKEYAINYGIAKP